jgi:hypothetical protein
MFKQAPEKNIYLAILGVIFIVAILGFVLFVTKNRIEGHAIKSIEPLNNVACLDNCRGKYKTDPECKKNPRSRACSTVISDCFDWCDCRSQQEANPGTNACCFTNCRVKSHASPECKKNLDSAECANVALGCIDICNACTPRYLPPSWANKKALIESEKEILRFNCCTTKCFWEKARKLPACMADPYGEACAETGAYSGCRDLCNKKDTKVSSEGKIIGETLGKETVATQTSTSVPLQSADDATITKLTTTAEY